MTASRAAPCGSSSRSGTESCTTTLAIGGDDPRSGFDAHLEAVGAERLRVAEADGRVVGLAGLVERGSKAELEPIVVDRAYRGRRVGTRLAETVVDAARAAGFRQVVVLPVARNAEAMRFLHALGFDVLGRADLRLDVAPDLPPRRPGEQLARREFRV